MSAPAPGTEVRIATWSHGVVAATICPLCGALVVAEAVEQHAAVHSLDLRGEREATVRPTE